MNKFQRVRRSADIVHPEQRCSAWPFVRSSDSRLFFFSLSALLLHAQREDAAANLLKTKRRYLRNGQFYRGQGEKKVFGPCIFFTRNTNPRDLVEVEKDNETGNEKIETHTRLTGITFKILLREILHFKGYSKNLGISFRSVRKDHERDRK